MRELVRALRDAIANPTATIVLAILTALAGGCLAAVLMLGVMG